MNRKLVRPSLADFAPVSGVMPTSSPPQRSLVPPQRCSHAEPVYYLRQMNAGNRVALTLTGGERIRGRIVWYDRASVRIERDDGPDLLLFKHCIRFIQRDDSHSDAS